MDFYSTLGYLSGLYFIRPDMEPAVLLRTAALIHMLDALLCFLIASHRGRSKTSWAVAGLLLGIWALAALFLLSEKKTN